MKLHDYQERGVAAALAAPGGRWIFNDETGLGKSGQALVAAQRRGAERCIIVCPANVRRNWEREVERWWPGHPPVGVIWGSSARRSVSRRKGEQLAAAYAAPIRIVSYSLLARLLEAGTPVADVIIFDECHLLQGAGSGWVAMARKLVGLCPGAAVFGLTATLMPNRPLDLWTVVDVIWPGRFGVGKGEKFSWKFAQRYTNADHNGYGWVYRGVAVDTQAELHARVQALSSRTTKQAVAHLLPPFTIRTLALERGSVRDAEVWAWCVDALQEVPQVAVMTHLRRTARELAEVIKLNLETEEEGNAEKTTVLCITGDDSPEERDRKLEDLRRAGRSVLVATVHSVGRGIDLTWCARALFAELYWRPETLVQGLGRFSRLSGVVPSLVDLMVTSGDVSERIANTIRDKLEAITSITSAAASEEKLFAAVGMQGGEEEFLRQLNEAAASFIGESDNIPEDDE